jgi:hypothetical protein
MMTRRWYVVVETSARVAIGIVGFATIFRARAIATLLTAGLATRALPILAAIVLALGLGELTIDHVRLRPAEWRVLDEEPQRQADAELGWRFIPHRSASTTSGGRTIAYALDGLGYRVRNVDQPVDVQRPSILFVGESVMFGDGLTYDESVPAQVERMLGVQSVNLGVYGYSVDQTYLRLRSELPRFREPIAVVALFMPTLFGRNLDDDRPHLGPGLVWLPARAHSRIVTLAGLFVPFRRDATIETGITMTRDVMRAIVDLASTRHATPLVVVPQMGNESEPEHNLRRRILDGAQVPYVFVPLDPSWHIPWDHHPDARAAGVLARAIASRLQTSSIDRRAEDFR